MSQILLVDHRDTCRERLAGLLESLGHSVDCSYSAAGAIGRLYRAGSDLIILNLLMPQLQGWQVLQWAHSHPRTSNTPVIIHSALSIIQRQLAADLGASEFWEPGAVSFGRIYDSIDAHLGRPLAMAA